MRNSIGLLALAAQISALSGSCNVATDGAIAPLTTQFSGESAHTSDEYDALRMVRLAWDPNGTTPDNIYGRGFDLIRGELKPSPLASTSPVPNEEHHRLAFEANGVESASDLATNLNVRAYAGVKGVGWNASVASDLVRTNLDHSFSKVFSVNLLTHSTRKSLIGSELSIEAAKFLKTHGPDAFVGKYGTGYVSDIQFGGEIVGFIRHSASSSAERTMFDASLRAKWPGGKVRLNIEQLRELSAENFHFNLSLQELGTTKGKEEVGPPYFVSLPATIAELSQAVVDFPKRVDNNPKYQSPMYFVVTPYSNLGSGLREAIVRFNDRYKTLGYIAEVKLQYEIVAARGRDIIRNLADYKDVAVDDVSKTLEACNVAITGLNGAAALVAEGKSADLSAILPVPTISANWKPRKRETFSLRVDTINAAERNNTDLLVQRLNEHPGTKNRIDSFFGAKIDFQFASTIRPDGRVIKLDTMMFVAGDDRAFDKKGRLVITPTSSKGRLRIKASQTLATIPPGYTFETLDVGPEVNVQINSDTRASADPQGLFTGVVIGLRAIPYVRGYWSDFHCLVEVEKGTSSSDNQLPTLGYRGLVTGAYYCRED